MIKLDESSFEEVYKIMVEAFPIEERRSKEAQRALFHNPLYEVYAYKRDNVICAFVSIWKMNSAHFVEHLAVDHTMRGTGIGKTLLEEYMASIKLPVVLEVEKPKDDIAKRRIHFYERIGFHLYDDIAYVQPAFHKGFDDLPLYIMSCPNCQSKDILTMIEELYQSVYQRAFK